MSENAAIYIRVSTEDQGQKYGPDVQRERCTAQAVAKGWQVVAEYYDDGISGTKGIDERPALADLMASVEAGEVDNVIVLALDRLGRKTSLVLDLVEAITAAGVDLVSCKESLDTSTPQGQFVLTMFAAIAQLERDTIVERTTAGRDRRGAIDGEKGGRVPYGYLRTDDGIILDPDPQARQTVRMIFDLNRDGLSLRQIAERLNEAGIETARGGGQWYASSVREILLNETAYRGGKRGNSPVTWPVLLSA